LHVTHVISSWARLIGGTLGIGVANRADDDADAGPVEATEGLVEVDGDARLVEADHLNRLGPIEQGCALRRLHARNGSE